jgi:hypothetical protein
MKRSSGIVAIATVCAMAPMGAWAQNAHFIFVDTPVIDTKTGALNISFKEAGLGSTAVEYTLSAGTGQFTFQCFTKSGNKPQGAPNNISVSNISQQTFITPRNGQITATISLAPEQDGASCQGGGLVLKLIHVAYADVTFTDVTDNLVGGSFPGPFQSDVQVVFPSNQPA